VPNHRSIIIASLLGVGAVIALSLFVINSLNPIKLVKTKEALYIPQIPTENNSPRSEVTDNWSLPQSSESARPLFLVLVNPSHLSTTENSQVKVNGQTATDAKVTINEKPLPISSDGSFTTYFPLAPGENEIVVTAVNNRGEENIQTAAVFTAEASNGSNLDIQSTAGIVTAISGTNYEIITTKGENASFDISALTRFISKFGGSAGGNNVSVGTEVEVISIGSQALLFRNLSENTHQAHLYGTITSLSTNDFDLTTPQSKIIKVNLSNSSYLPSFYKEGQEVWVFGEYDPRNQAISNIKEIL